MSCKRELGKLLSNLNLLNRASECPPLPTNPGHWGLEADPTQSLLGEPLTHEGSPQLDCPEMSKHQLDVYTLQRVGCLRSPGRPGNREGLVACGSLTYSQCVSWPTKISVHHARSVLQRPPQRMTSPDCHFQELHLSLKPLLLSQATLSLADWKPTFHASPTDHS